jgi:hypothetical protein
LLAHVHPPAHVADLLGEVAGRGDRAAAQRDAENLHGEDLHVGLEFFDAFQPVGAQARGMPSKK